MKNLIGKRITKTTTFMGEKIEISKLTVTEVEQVQEAAKAINTDSAESNGFELVRLVVRLSVKNASDISDQDFNSFPMDELSSLSGEIMKFSGMGGAGK